jgi:hypothetical protein
MRDCCNHLPGAASVKFPQVLNYVAQRRGAVGLPLIVANKSR